MIKASIFTEDGAETSFSYRGSSEFGDYVVITVGGADIFFSSPDKIRELIKASEQALQALEVEGKSTTPP